MNSGLSPADPTLVAAFKSALLHQGGIALLVIAFCWLVWATGRTWQLTTPVAKAAGAGGATGTAESMKATGNTKAAGTGDVGGAAGTDGATGVGAGLRRLRQGTPEPRGRWLLRVGFGVI